MMEHLTSIITGAMSDRAQLLLMTTSTVAAIAVISAGLFMLKRHLLYTKYMKASGIKFLPITSYISGSWHSVASKEHSLARQVDRIYKSLKSDTFGLFVGNIPVVITHDLDLLFKVWVTDSVKHINKPDAGAVVPVVYNSLLLLPDDNWRRVRRAVASTMTPAKLKLSDLERDIDICLDNLLACLRKKQQSDDVNWIIVDSFKLFKDLSMDISLRSGVNQPNKIDYSIENKIVTSAEHMMKEGMSAAIYTMFVPAITPIVAFMAKVLKLTKFLDYVVDASLNIIEEAKTGGLKNHHNHSDDDGNVRNENIESKPNRKIIDSLLDVYNRKKISKDELVANTFIMLLAVWDTTGETMVVLMWFLAKNLRVQDKLRHSVMTNGIDSEYLDWTIKEALRFNPPVNTFRHIEEDIHWKQYKVMKGTCLTMVPYLIHRDKSIWGEDALEFRPERFESMDQWHPVKYCPFGLGPRNCVGNYMAIYILKRVISRIVMEYKMEPCQGTPEELELKAGTEVPMFLSVLKGISMPIKFTPVRQ